VLKRCFNTAAFAAKSHSSARQREGKVRVQRAEEKTQT